MAATEPKSASEIRDSIQDAKIDAWRSDLLALAFKAASKFPLKVHHKNRARDQEVVVSTCLELDQLRSALAMSEDIEGWTNGYCLADVAFHLANHGDRAVVSKLLERAVQVGDDVASTADFQEWQRDRIRVKVAQTHALLGEDEEAAKLSKNVEPSETGKVEAVKAMIADASTFDQQLADIDRVIAAKQFDVTRNVVDRCTKLYDRFYDDAAKRSAIEDRIRGARTAMPLQPSIDFCIDVARIAVAHADKVKTADFVKETLSLIESVKWLPEDYVPLRLKVVPLLWNVGKLDDARSEVQAALAFFEAERSKIVNIYRGRVLRAIAETYATIGDTTSAIAAYQRAVEEGMENPNSRPRTDDLVATCCSLARGAVEPTAALRARLADIVEKLGDPW